MRQAKHLHKKRNVLLLILLAVLCIVGTELAVCRIAAPETFAAITAPVRGAFHSLFAAISSASETITAKLREDETVDQTVSEPTVSTERTTEDPSVTAFAFEDGRELLTGGVLPLIYYNQAESPWCDMSFGPDPIATHGCGPTTMAMVISSLTESNVDPGEMSSWASENGYCAPGSGSYLSIVEGASSAYGLSVSSWESRDSADLLQALASGNIFVALMTRGHFTNGGHFIILRGATLDGSVLVADPNSRDRSLIAWDPQLILDELSPSTTSGAPLWCLPVENLP